MNRVFIKDFGFWLEGSLTRYIEFLSSGGTRVALGGQSSNWKTDKVRASSLDACPKYHAAERHGMVSKHFDNRKLYQFELANRAADVYKEAVIWALDGEESVGPWTWSAEDEHRIDSEDGLAGTIDLLLRCLHATGHSDYVPLEIKRTDADAHEGLASYQIWQLIAYMYLTRAPMGYLVTLYQHTSSMGTHRVWPVVSELDGWWVMDLNGNPAEFESEDWPRRDGHNFFSLLELEKKLKIHEIYNGQANVMEADPPYKEPSWRCGWIKKEERYMRGYTNPSTGVKFLAGDLKPDSNTIQPTCPLFDHCWKDKPISLRVKAGLSV